MNSDIYYHIYNRGAHKADVFLDGSDYLRMLKLLYIANNEEPFVMSKLPNNIYLLERSKPLVDIVAYCLMPNHIHIALKKRSPNQKDTSDPVTKFIHKLMTGYSAYFNIKYRHSGTLWQGPYKHKTAYDDLYIKTLINYIHLNPRGIREAQVSKQGNQVDDKEMIEYAMNYEYSSIKDYLGTIRQQSAILNPAEIARFLT